MFRVNEFGIPCIGPMPIVGGVLPILYVDTLPYMEDHKRLAFEILDPEAMEHWADAVPRQHAQQFTMDIITTDDETGQEHTHNTLYTLRNALVAQFLGHSLVLPRVAFDEIGTYLKAWAQRRGWVKDDSMPPPG